MKKIVSGILALTFLFTATACNSDTGKEKDNDAELDTLVEKYDYQWTDTAKPILNEKGAEDLTFNVYSSKNASAQDYNDMKIMEDLYESTNVDVFWENVSESVYEQQKNLIFGNEDERPDAIYHAGMSQGEIIKYAQREVLLPISDYLDYMPNFSKILEQRPDIKSQLENVEDGKIYSLPRVEEMGLLKHPNLLFLNIDWTEKAIEAGAVDNLNKGDLVDGLTLDSLQMEQILTYFRDNDMNGNGDANDERPLNFVYNNWQGNQHDLYGMFGINDNLEHRLVVDDEIVYTVEDPRYKDATNFIADWVSKKLIDPVSFEQSQDNFLANGKGLETYGAFYWWESETVVSNPENYIVLSPLVGPDGDQTVSVSNNPEISIGELIIFNEIDNPEVLLTYFDRYYDPYISAQINYGPVGIVYEEELDEDGMLVQKDLPEGVTADELRLQHAPLGIIYLSDYAWENVVNMEPRAKLRLKRLDEVAKPYVPETVDKIPNLQFTLEELNVINNYETNLNDYVRINLINWLTKGGVEDSDWDNFQDELKTKVKLDEIKEVYQNAYDRYISENEGE